MTGYEKIKAMSINEIADFLAEIFKSGDENTITKWFNQNYCDKKCQTVKIIKSIDFPSLVVEEWNECDFEGNCPYYKTDKDILKLWLEGEVSE